MKKKQALGEEQKMGLIIGCIADDFTGGSDAASFLRKGGLSTLLINGDSYRDSGPGSGTQAVVLALKTRSAEPEEAVAQSAEALEWLLEQGAEKIYFKYCSTFDSTPRGNIGPVTDMLMERLDAPYTLLCPALPVNGRTVQEGVLYVNGVPLGESSMRFHPVNPMWESRIDRLMAPQSKYPCLVLDSGLMASGPAAVRDALSRAAAEAGHITAVPDYYDSRQGAELAENFGDLPLLTGGSGLLEHLARRASLGLEKEGTTEDFPDASGRRLILAGSCSAMTIKQVEAYLAAGGRAIRMEPEKLIRGEQKQEDFLRAIRETEEDLLIYSSAAPEELYRGEGAEQVSALLEGTMARLARAALDLGIKKLIVAGGETSGAVTRRLGFSRFYIGDDAAPGVPVMRPAEEPGLALALKSGNFGDENFFINTLV